MSLKAAIFTAEPVPFVAEAGKREGLWSAISCTLLYTRTECLLVDTPITIEQNKALIRWIKSTAPGRQLKWIYITHGHPDHWFGLPLLLETFAEAQAYATRGTIAHMKAAVEPEVFERTWGAWFGDRVARPFTFAQPLPLGNKLTIDDQWVCEAVEVGHSDTYDSTVLWVPSLRLVAAGDVIYGEYHQMLAIANTTAKREEWLRAIDVVDNLDPVHVIAGHRRPDEVPGRWCIDSTRQYIRDFERLLEEARGSTEGASYLIKEMLKLHGDRANPMVIRWGAAANLSSSTVR